VFDGREGKQGGGFVPRLLWMGRPEDFSSRFHYPSTTSGGYVLGSSKSTDQGRQVERERQGLPSMNKMGNCFELLFN